MGAQVKKTARRRKDFLPHASDSAPISGAHRKDRMPWSGRVEKGKGGGREEGGTRSAQRNSMSLVITLMSDC